jgi:hypothetical protein
MQRPRVGVTRCAIRGARETVALWDKDPATIEFSLRWRRLSRMSFGAMGSRASLTLKIHGHERVGPRPQAATP